VRQDAGQLVDERVRQRQRQARLCGRECGGVVHEPESFRVGLHARSGARPVTAPQERHGHRVGAGAGLAPQTAQLDAKGRAARRRTSARDIRHYGQPCACAGQRTTAAGSPATGRERGTRQRIIELF
jgi:hypothetical protein